MANEPSLKINDIFDIDDYLDELEGKEPEVHSGTLRKEELDDINDRAAELVPEYQPSTSELSLHNLISIKANTIDKEQPPEPEEGIAVKFFYADPFCLGIKRDFDLNDEYWTKVPDTGPAYDAWNPKDDSGISYSLMGHTFTGSDVWLYSGYRDNNNYEIEVDPDAIDREGLEQTTVKVPIVLTFPKGAFLSGTTPSKAVNYSFTFTDDLNGGDYPYKSETIDTSDPTVTWTRGGDIDIDGRHYAENTYKLSDSSVFKNQGYDSTIQPLIKDDVFDEIILLINGETKEFTINELSDSDGVYSVNIKNGDSYVGTLYPGDNDRGFKVTLPGEEIFPA